MSTLTRKARLEATLHGAPVDRPPVCFYEINGLDENPDDPDPFNIYNDPSWKPLIELAAEKSDRIVMRKLSFVDGAPSPLEERTVDNVVETEEERVTYTEVDTGSRKLTSTWRRHRDIRTTWRQEHLLKDEEDIEAFLAIPPSEAPGRTDVEPVITTERELGNTGIVMLDTADPICMAATLFELGTFTIIALTRPDLMHRLLDRFAAELYPKIEQVCNDLPGYLWRIYGPEYASPPYLPPDLFREYVVRYDEPIVKAIQRSRGYARLHSHGKLHAILDHIASLGCDGLDPIEPPPQGDVELSYVRRNYGSEMVLFGNIEERDIEVLTDEEFRAKAQRALREGTDGAGRGFVLMPSACPYGRKLPDQALRNYTILVESAEELADSNAG